MFYFYYLYPKKMYINNKSRVHNCLMHYSRYSQFIYTFILLNTDDVMFKVSSHDYIIIV